MGRRNVAEGEVLRALGTRSVANFSALARAAETPPVPSPLPGLDTPFTCVLPWARKARPGLQSAVLPGLGSNWRDVHGRGQHPRPIHPGPNPQNHGAVRLLSRYGMSFAGRISLSSAKTQRREGNLLGGSAAWRELFSAMGDGLIDDGLGAQENANDQPAG